MESKDQFWNREELYDEVWSTPMRTLAKKCGLSDVGLAKVCRKLSIPVPPRGYWAKRQVGQSVKRLPLPLIKEAMRLRRPPPPREEAQNQELGTPEERALLERLEAAAPESVLKRGALSHPLILQASTVLKKADADDRGILWTHDPCLDIRVSKSSLDRAIRLMAGFIGLIEEAGFAVSVGKGHREETSATILGQTLKFGLVERADRLDQMPVAPGSLVDRVLTYGGKPVKYQPSGKLVFEVWNVWRPGTKRWRDGKTAELEDLCPKS